MGCVDVEMIGSRVGFARVWLGLYIVNGCGLG